MLIEARRTPEGFELWYPSGKGMLPLWDGLKRRTMVFSKDDIYKLAYRGPSAFGRAAIAMTPKGDLCEVQIRQGATT